MTLTREFLQQLHDLLDWYGAEIRIQKGDDWEPPFALLFLQAGTDDPADAEFYGVTINPDTITLLINSIE